MKLAIALMLIAQLAPAPKRKVTVQVVQKPHSVVVCSILPEGMIVGGGDNCDFHNQPDPIYCSVFKSDKGCEHPEGLPYECGTTFGCQNVKDVEWVKP